MKEQVRLGLLVLMMNWPAVAAAGPPEATGSTILGVAETSIQSRFDREPNIDRSGNDIRSEKLAAGANVGDCEQRCAATEGCVAYTFVKQSSTVPLPICWLKDTVPHGYASSCCTSGVLRRK
ncbi:MAG: PAN domain-containing protein [Xanthobacteraceae bacterium]